MGKRARLGAGALAATAVLGAAAGVGRWEGSRHERAENRGIARVYALVGGIEGPAPDAFRIDQEFKFDCLLWKRGTNPYALELCFDRSGHVIEAIDRRSGSPEIASLREHPEAAAIRVDRTEVVRLLKKLGAPPPRGGWR
jgi:hypothetical protein